MFRYDQFQDACCWERIFFSQNSISMLSVFVFPTVNVYLEGYRAGSWWKHSYFWMRQVKRWRRVWEPGGWDQGTQNNVLCGAPTECDFEGAHSKISAMGPEFLATALRAITGSGPSTVYHLVFTPILLFPYCNPTEECFSTWRWKVFNRPLTNKSLFSRP